MKKVWVLSTIGVVVIIFITIFITLVLVHKPYIPPPPEQEEYIPPPPKAVVIIFVDLSQERENTSTAIIYDQNIKTGEVVYVNETVYFDSRSSQGRIDTYMWTISGPTGAYINTGYDPQGIQYWEEGEYYFKLTVSNKGGSDSFSGSFTVVNG